MAAQHQRPPPPPPPGAGYGSMEQHFGAMSLNGSVVPRPPMGGHAQPQVKGFTLRRAERAGKPLTWSVCKWTPLPFPEHELQDQVNEQQRRGKMSKRFRKLSPNQQTQVETLAAEETENDPSHAWVVAYVDTEKKSRRSPYGFEVQPETVAVHIILERQARAAGASGPSRTGLTKIVDINARRHTDMGGPPSHFSAHGPMQPQNMAGGPAGMRPGVPMPPPQPPLSRPPPGGYRGNEPSVGVVPAGPPRPGHGGPPAAGYGGHDPNILVVPAGPPRPGHGGPPAGAYRGRDPNVVVVPAGPPRPGHGGPPAGAYRGRDPNVVVVPNGSQRPGPGGPPPPRPPPGAGGPSQGMGPPPPHRGASRGPPAGAGRSSSRRSSSRAAGPHVHQTGHVFRDDSSEHTSESGWDSDQSSPSSFSSFPSSPKSGHHRNDSFVHVKLGGGRRRSDGRTTTDSGRDAEREHRRPSRPRGRHSSHDDLDHQPSGWQRVHEAPAAPRRRNSVAHEPSYMPRMYVPGQPPMMPDPRRLGYLPTVPTVMARPEVPLVDECLLEQAQQEQAMRYLARKQAEAQMMRAQDLYAQESYGPELQGQFRRSPPYQARGHVMAASNYPPHY
ncbi:MAG: hypothetical protein M1832_004322 [Thelocarpon impressellum]|nr:MAG: hypothetical protein M1832_004322 [Thelocarpon impressellum]